MLTFHSANHVTIHGAALRALAMAATDDDGDDDRRGVCFEPHHATAVVATGHYVMLASTTFAPEGAVPADTFRVSKAAALAWAKLAGERGTVEIRAHYKDGVIEHLAAEIRPQGGAMVEHRARPLLGDFAQWYRTIPASNPRASRATGPLVVRSSYVTTLVGALDRVHTAAEYHRRDALPLAERRKDTPTAASITIWPAGSDVEPVFLAARIDGVAWRVAIAPIKVMPGNHAIAAHPAGTFATRAPLDAPKGGR